LNSTPDAKVVGPVTAGAGGGAAVAAIICWLLEQFAGITVPVGIQGSFAFVLALAGGYLVPTRRGGEHSA